MQLQLLPVTKFIISFLRDRRMDIVSRGMFLQGPWPLVESRYKRCNCMITLRAAIFLSYDPSSGCKLVSTQYLEFEMCFVSPMRLIFKTFCRGGWFIGDGGACLKLEKQPFMSCLFISLTAFNTEKLSETWNQWKGHPIFRAQPLVIR